MNYVKNYLLALFIILTLKTKAQDPTFSQFNSVPLYFNPAFAGSVEKSRLALSYRNQWAGIYKTFYVSYDQAVQKIHGGAGIIISNDNAGAMNVFYSGIVYAPKFNIMERIAISPAIKVGYRRQSVDMSQLTFGDMIDPANGFTPTYEEIILVRNNIDLSAGLVINTENMYLGLAIDHINQPNINIIEGGKSPLPAKYVGQFGYTFQKNETSDLSVSPSILYQKQASFSIFQANLSFKYKWATIGAGYSNAISYTFMLGYHRKSVMVGYSYDYYKTMSQISEKLYAHEISLKYIFSLKRKKKEES